MRVPECQFQTKLQEITGNSVFAQIAALVLLLAEGIAQGLYATQG